MKKCALTTHRFFQFKIRFTDQWVGCCGNRDIVCNNDSEHNLLTTWCFFCDFLLERKKKKMQEAYTRIHIQSSAFCQRGRKFKWEQQKGNRQTSNATKPRMIQVILMRFDAAAEIFHYPLFFHFAFFFILCILVSSTINYIITRIAQTWKKLTLLRTLLKKMYIYISTWAFLNENEHETNEAKQSKANLINFETRK